MSRHSSLAPPVLRAFLTGFFFNSFFGIQGTAFVKMALVQNLSEAQSVYPSLHSKLLLNMRSKLMDVDNQTCLFADLMDFSYQPYRCAPLRGRL